METNITTVLGALFLTVGAGSAQAMETGGKWGFGGSFETPRAPAIMAPEGRINGLVWIGDLGIEGRLALSVVSPDGGDTSIGSGGGVGVLYNIAKFESVNVSTGLHFDGRFFYGGGEADNARYELSFTVPLRGEYFVTDHFAINASVGLGLDIGIDPSFVAGGTSSSGFIGNAGFIWYLN